MGPHRVGDPNPGPVPLGPAHGAIVGKRHVVAVVVDIDRAAQLGHPEPDAVVGELEQDPLELRAGECSLWFGDDQGVPASVRVFKSRKIREASGRRSQGRLRLLSMS